MGFRSWLLRPLATDTTGDWFVAFRDALEANRSHAGVSVTQETSLGLPAVYRCRSLNSSTVAALPLNVYRKQNGRRVEYPKPVWMRKPNDYLSFREVIGQLQDSVEADGNGFALKAVTRGGQLEGLYPLNPRVVDVVRDANTAMIHYEVAQHGGSRAVVYPSEMFHIRGYTPAGEVRGVSPIAAMKEAIGLGLAAQQYGAQFFGSGATLSGLITMPTDPGEAKAKAIVEAFGRKHGGLSKSHALGILTGGAQWVPLSVNPEESQFLETRKFSAVEIACAYGVPAYLVTEAEGAKGFVSSLYATMYFWLLTGIDPRLIAWEDALTALLPNESLYAKFNRNAFLAMDPSERAEFYGKGLIGRYMVPNEIREKEDMDPLPGGDEALWSVQWGPPPQPKPVPDQPAQAGFPLPEGGTHEA